MPHRATSSRFPGTAVRTIDISMPLFDGMPSFPGDPPFRSSRVQRLEDGAPYDLSSLTLSTHAGTHLDPPSHFVSEGLAIDGIDLDTLSGPCVVLEVPPRCTSVGAPELEKLPPGVQRVLLRTSNSLRWAERLEFFPDFVGIELPAARLLTERGVRLVGIDALSIETDRTETYPVHRELLGRGILILEGLLLAEASPGAYELACLPLALRGGDGGPARAVLRTL